MELLVGLAKDDEIRLQIGSGNELGGEGDWDATDVMKKAGSKKRVRVKLPARHKRNINIP